MRLIESVVTGLADRIRDDLPMQLAQIEVEVGDGVPLDPPAIVLDYMPRLGEVSEWPLVCVLAGPSESTADAGSWMMSDHEVAVCVFVQEADPQWLAKKLLRYQRAIIEVMVKNRTGALDSEGGSAWSGLNYTRTEPGDRFVHASNPAAFTEYTVVFAKATEAGGLLMAAKVKYWTGGPVWAPTLGRHLERGDAVDASLVEGDDRFAAKRPATPDQPTSDTSESEVS